MSDPTFGEPLYVFHLDMLHIILFQPYQSVLFFSCCESSGNATYDKFLFVF